MSLTFEELRRANLDRLPDFPSGQAEVTWSPQDWACAMGGECGEALNLVKKLRRLGTFDELEKTYSVAQLIDYIGQELADTLMYLDLLAWRLGINLEEAVRCKFNQKSDEVGSKVKL